MSVTRREFLDYAAASLAATTLARWPSGGLVAFDDGAVILDEHCMIPESSAGYEAALRAPECARARILVAPAVMHLSKASIRAVLDRLDTGGTVILESGALFASESSGAFRSHRAMLCDEFGILVGAPVTLWPAPSTPYTRYIWPCSAMVRDYSRVIPLTADRARVIAVLDDMPV